MAAKYELHRDEGAAVTDAPIATLTPEEGEQVFDRLARRRLGMSGEEFLRRWDAGEFAADCERPGLMEVVLALPFVGR